jgi:hypothetical protein
MLSDRNENSDFAVHSQRRFTNVTESHCIHTRSGPWDWPGQSASCLRAMTCALTRPLSCTSCESVRQLERDVIPCPFQHACVARAAARNPGGGGRAARSNRASSCSGIVVDGSFVRQGGGNSFSADAGGGYALEVHLPAPGSYFRVSNTSALARCRPPSTGASECCPERSSRYS